MIVTHKSNGSNYVQVAFKWQGTRRYVSFGHKCKMNLAAAEKYMDQIKQMRAECGAKCTAPPVNPPSPKKIPKLGKLIAEYKKSIQPDDSLPWDLYMQIIEKHRQMGISGDEHVRLLKEYEKNYAKLMADKRQKIAEAQRKRLATIAANKAKKFDGTTDAMSAS